MSDHKKFIGFDLGAESGRCVVGELSEERLKLTEVHRFPTPNIAYTAGIFWDVLVIYQELLKGLTLAKEKFGSDYFGISIDTWGVDYVLLDADNRVLGYPYHYRDSRNDAAMEASFDIVKKEDLYNKTGIQFMPFNTVFQLLAEKRSQGNLLKNAERMLLMPDFLAFMLCGVARSEYTIASTSGLINPYKRTWDDELIEAYGFPKHIFSEIVEPGTILGNILPEIADKTGINKNIPVIAGAGHDTAAAVASVPAGSGNWAYLSSGTWSLMGRELDQPFINEKALDYNFTNEGGVENTIRFHKNIIGLWPVQECKRHWQSQGQEYSYPELTRMAEACGPANAWIDLDDWRFARTGNMPEVIINFLDESHQKYRDTPDFLVRVILESLAFTYRDKIAEIEKVTGTPVNRLHAVGGGIQNELLTQFTADAIDREVVAGPVEGTIIGNIGVQAIATNTVANLTAWRHIVSESFDLKIYQPKNSEYFIKNESRYHRIQKK